MQERVFHLQNMAGIIIMQESVKKIAETMGFDIYDQHRIATAVSELARNAVKYAGGGTVEVYPSEEGIEIICRDKGRGMSMRGVSHGLGIGLLGVEHMMDDLTIDTGENGTSIRIRKWLR
ncbi:hypothetical protein FHEFKHOI_00865 [Candidatus Methanoperedenaceae archaeon GB50]|nr:hypothetical protein AIOGIFDO_00859 [Candidatus Methanoperedenaceae archaeon GB37]CAD7770716.1 hypothetical protein FHEFKHOI_00865 [Candidatus Methanoperedenaceae archaeon GB50]